MNNEQFDKLYRLVDRLDDRLWYLTIMVFFIMVGVCSK